MEVAAAVSSITAIIQFSAIIIKTTTDFIHNYREVPAELKHIAELLIILRSELEIIDNLREEACGDSLILLPDEIKQFHRALEVTQALILDFKNACSKYKPDVKISKSSKIKWILQDQAKMKSMSARLDTAQSSLNNILILVNTRIASASRKHIELGSALATTAFTTIIKDVDTIRRIVERVSQRGKIPQNMVLNGLATRGPHEGNKFWNSIVFLEKSWLDVLGIQAAVSWYGNDYQTTYSYSSRYRILGLKVLATDLCLRRFPIAGLGFQCVWGGINFKNIVPENSPIMKACKKGDLTTVRQLFKRGKASTEDVTPQNSSPMRYAIESGNEDVVHEILFCGGNKNANAPFGQFMTSPLEWAFASRQIGIARLLIERGARVDHISAKGWTPAFNLFGYDWLHGNRGPCREYLELLSGKGFSEYEVRDGAGWSTIHRAAAHGTADDITALIERGCSVNLLTEMYWKPINCAVRFENVDTFLELAKDLRPSEINDQDIRGWSLLHQATWQGSSVLLDLILQYGADPHIVTMATSYGVPEGLEDKAMTAFDIATHKGSDARKILNKALLKAGYDLAVHHDSDDDDIEVFWEPESEYPHDEKLILSLVKASSDNDCHS